MNITKQDLINEIMEALNKNEVSSVTTRVIKKSSNSKDRKAIKSIKIVFESDDYEPI